MKKIKLYMTIIISVMMVLNSSLVAMATLHEAVSENEVPEFATETMVSEVEEVSANEMLLEINGDDSREKAIGIPEEVVAAEKAGTSFLSATNSAFNRNIDGITTDYDKEHYYRFSLPSAGVVSIQFSHPLYESYAEGWYIYLYDASFNKIDSMPSSDGYKANVTGANIGLPAGSYYVVVEYNSSVCLNKVYTLRLNYTQSNVWETEFNDGWLSADGLLTNITYYGTTTLWNEKDYYKFTLPSAGVLSIQFSHPLYESYAEGWYICLYDDKHNKIDAMPSSDGYTANVSGTNIGLPAGSYYVVVEYNSSVCLNKVYTLRLNYTQSNVWETEFNDGWLSADGLLTNITYYGTTTLWNEKDYYKFTIKSGRLVWFYLASNKGADMYLYDANKNKIDCFSMGTEDGACTDDFYLASGTYYLVIEGNMDINYNFSVNAQPDIGTVVTKNGLKYKVAKNGTKNYMQCIGPVSKNITSATIKSSILVNGFEYPITQIKSSAFQNCKKLKKLTIGSNVKIIGSKVFYGCKKLKSIKIKSKKITSIKTKAFKGIYKNAKIDVPNSKKSKYKKLLKKAGVKSTALIK